MSTSKSLWEAVGELRRTRRELVSQLSEVRRHGTEPACSFCGATPEDEPVLIGPGDANICARCVELAGEILELA